MRWPEQDPGGRIAAFLKCKRALGCRFDNEERALRLFARFLDEEGIGDLRDVDPATVARFMASRARAMPRSFNHLLGVVRRFFAWLVAQGYLVRSPVDVRPRRNTRTRAPFLFGAEDIRRLLCLASSLADNSRAPMRGPTYHTAFALLAALGLRVGEVSRLLWRDVQLDEALLAIRDTKFYKSRLVPFGPKVESLLVRYREARTDRFGVPPEDSPVFSFVRGRTVNPYTISQTFHAMVPRLGLPQPPGVRSPSVHCLRHSFAVRTLLQWYRSGIDPGSRLLHLATFLGHASVSSTAVYLTITDELLEEANGRFARFAEPCIPEAEP